MNDSEDRYRTMIDAIPAMVWSSQPEGSVEFANRRWHDYTGLSAEELHGWGWKVAVHPDDSEAIIGKWQALVASGQPGEIEGRVTRFDTQLTRLTRLFAARAWKPTRIKIRLL